MKPQWAAHFKIDDAKWETLWQKAVSEGTPLPAVAIESGLVDEAMLLNHERENAKLPSLKLAFFDGEPPMDLWAQCKFRACAKNGCMPVATWDEKVYWAKITGDVLDIEADLKDVMWVLAPWSGLKKWFEIWQSSQDSSHEASEESGVLVKGENEDASDGPPAGFDVKDIPLPTVDFGGIKMPSENSEKSSATLSAITGTKIDITTMPQVQMPPKPQAAAPMNPPPPPVRPAPSINAVSESVPPLPSSAVEIAPIPLESLSDKLRGAANQEDLANAILGGWQNYFEKIMILLVQGNGIIIWRWSGQWHGTFQRGQVIQLDTPSIFKIANDTAHPYHGYVSPGPTNDQFFKLANGGQYPPHVTVAPVITDGVVVAMLCGACTVEAGKAIVLNRLEDQTKLFAEGLLRFTQSGTKKAG